MLNVSRSARCGHLWTLKNSIKNGILSRKMTREERKREARPNKDNAGIKREPAAGGQTEASLEELSKEELIERLKQAEERARKNFELYLRSQAEIENMKKRFQREKEDFFKFANEALIKELLPVVDSLEKALEHATEKNSIQALKEGVELTLKALRNALCKAGVEEICAVGERFDPHFHEAVSQCEDEKAEPGTVLQELQKGYLLNQRLIRPSMVVVSTRPEGCTQTQGDEGRREQEQNTR